MSDCFRIKRSSGRVTEIRRVPTGNADVTRRTAPNTNPAIPRRRQWREEEKTKRETSRWLRRGRNPARITDCCVTDGVGNDSAVAIAALYRTLVYTSAEHHALFMNGSPKIRRQRGTTRVRERKVERWGHVVSFPSLAATNHLRLSVSDGGSGGEAPCFKEIQIVSDTKVAGAESVVGWKRRLSSKLEHRHKDLNQDQCLTSSDRLGTGNTRNVFSRPSPETSMRVTGIEQAHGLVNELSKVRTAIAIRTKYIRCWSYSKDRRQVVGKKKIRNFPNAVQNGVTSRVAQRASSCARFPQLSNSSRLSNSTRTGEQPAVAARGNSGACREYHRKKHILAPSRRDVLFPADRRTRIIKIRGEACTLWMIRISRRRRHSVTPHVELRVSSSCQMRLISAADERSSLFENTLSNVSS
ncbi:hypothetical protein ALC60_02219 [Trachymyrmex zeteki]|uniref:Uncharacterized protein n=1 Tax=Mycetomoellerius zeteki TaxID=64791 RepID=A0A151XDW7_9HYME|nr:hypothetical protein ALC60_02219 [Trachymyrmex zeteki]